MHGYTCTIKLCTCFFFLLRFLCLIYSPIKSPKVEHPPYMDSKARHSQNKVFLGLKIVLHFLRFRNNFNYVNGFHFLWNAMNARGYRRSMTMRTFFSPNGEKHNGLRFTMKSVAKSVSFLFRSPKFNSVSELLFYCKL